MSSGAGLNTVEVILRRAVSIKRAWAPKRKYNHTAETDALIADAYRRFREFNNRKAIIGVAAKLGWPRHTVVHRAGEIGLSKTKERPWSDPEEQLLEQWSGLGVQAIRRKLVLKGFNRTETAINLKMKRNKVREVLKFFSARRLAEFFGVDDHKVTLWIRSGALSAERKGTRRIAEQGGDSFAVHRAALTRFILNHPEEIDLSKISDKYLFLDIVSGGKLCEEFQREVA